MTSQQCYVIVGAGHAGCQLAASLREQGYSGRIILVEGQVGLPYQRPPLSKNYLLGKIEADSLHFRSPQFFDEADIEFLPGVRIESIDRSQRQVRLSTEDTVSYDHLVLATGADNRQLPIPGVELDGVGELRTLADAQKVRDNLKHCRKAVVIGGGFIGMEFAAVAAQLGIEVTVMELAARPFERALSDTTAQHLVDLHRQHGVVFRCNVQVNRIVGDASNRVQGVVLAGEEYLEADIVMIGVGVVPNTTLAQEAGLHVDNGVVVDECLSTSDPAISAIGDCANYPSVFLDNKLVRLESVQNAVDQARLLAQRLTGKDVTYVKVPWFWSDQFDVKLQIAGLSTGWDQAVLRQVEGKKGFSVFCMRDGKLLAVESINAPADHITARKLIEKSVNVTAEQIQDTSRNLKDLLI